MFLIAQFMLMELFITGAFADGTPPPGGTPVGTGGTPVSTRIDDGIGILLVLGIAYGCYKIYEILKKKKVTIYEEEQV